MPNPSRPPTTTDDPRFESMDGCLVRLFWLILGNAALLVLALLIYRDAHSVVSPMSIGYWFVVAGIVLARYVDIQRFRGLTTSGERATLSDFRRFWPRVLLMAGALWGGAHVL